MSSRKQTKRKHHSRKDIPPSAIPPMLESLEPRLLLDGGSLSLPTPNPAGGEPAGSAYLAPLLAGTNASPAFAAAQANVDLVGQIRRETLPDDVVAGLRVRGFVQVQVRNVGVLKVPPAARVDIDVFARNTETNELIVIGQLANRNVANLAPNGARVRTYTVRVNLPEGLPKGDYEIQAVITPVNDFGEENLANNLADTLPDGQTVGITSADPFIDLVAGVHDRLAARFTLPEATVSGNGQRLRVPITVTNEGNVRVARGQRIDVNIYAENAAGEKVLLDTLTQQSISNLAPGRSKLINAQVILPPGLATGEYTIVAEVDASNVVAESDETNNTAVLPSGMNVQEGFADLTPTITKVIARTPVKPNQRVTVLANILNEGNIRCKGRVNVEISTFVDGQLYTLYTKENQRINLAPGREKTFRFSFQPPVELPCGDYDLLVNIQPADGFVEGGLEAANNTAETAGAFTFDNPYKKEWIEQFRFTDPTSVAVDSEGNSYLASYTVYYASEESYGVSTGYLRKFDPTGKLLWTRKQSRVEENMDLHLATDATGNVFLAGSRMINRDEAELFISKYSGAGRLLWSKSLDSDINGFCHSLAVDSVGNLYISGETYNSLFADVQGDSDAFLVKYDADGNLIWGRQYDGSNSYVDIGESAAVDAQGNVYLSGTTYTDQRRASDGFLVRYDSDGNLLWSRQQDFNVFDHSRSVGVDGAGNAYLAGILYEYKANQNGYDSVLYKYDSMGNEIWSRGIGESEALDTCTSILVDVNGNSYVIGDTENTLGAFHAGASDLYISKHDSDGNELWTRQLGTWGAENVMDAALDAVNGFLYVCGITDDAFGDKWTERNDWDFTNAFLGKFSSDMSMAPDLELKVGKPAKGKPKAAGQARIDFLNNGDGVGIGQVDYQLWATSDGLIDGSAGDYLLKTVEDELFIHAPGVTRSFWVDYELPEGVNPNDVKLVAQLDAAGGNYYGAVDQEGTVNMSDFTILASNWGSTGSTDNNYYGCVMFQAGPTTPIISISGGQPDDMTVEVTEPTDGIPDTTGQFRIYVTNGNDEVTYSEVALDLWCTSDGVIDENENDYLLWSHMGSLLDLYPNSTISFYGDYELPVGIDPGDVELIARITGTGVVTGWL
ncbi:MAG: SBBP repeat-containing protein [Phycisphaerae bacterium]|nr:SBBP repeat-containing protein [Phycisphaerae bacterium]